MKNSVFTESDTLSKYVKKRKEKRLIMRLQGTRNYHGETHAGSLVAAVHNHADWERHVGSGEFEAVLNGVQFKTRHNDYQLHMPSRDSSNFLAVDEIPFPPVPPTVLAKRSVKSQVGGEVFALNSYFYYGPYEIDIL